MDIDLNTFVLPDKPEKIVKRSLPGHIWNYHIRNLKAFKLLIKIIKDIPKDPVNIFMVLGFPVLIVGFANIERLVANYRLENFEVLHKTQHEHN